MFVSAALIFNKIVILISLILPVSLNINAEFFPPKKKNMCHKLMSKTIREANNRKLRI